MIIKHSIKQLKTDRLSAICIGRFDGVHIAHKKILQKTKQEAAKIKGISIVISFSNHPYQVLHPHNKNFGLLCTEEDKITRIAEAGIDYYISLDFNQKTANTTYLDFIHLLKKQLNMHTLVMGQNHHFGKEQGGCLPALRTGASQENIKIALVNDVYIGKEKISSSAIRTKILQGNLAGANAMLGYPYGFPAYKTGTWKKYTRFMPLNRHLIFPPTKQQYNITVNGQPATACTDAFYIYVETVYCNQMEKVNISFIS